MISASSIMSGDRRSITVDSDMEEASDGDVKNDSRGGQEKPSTAAPAGLNKSQSKGKPNQGNTKKQEQQQGAKENYPVYQPSPILSKPSFEAAAMPNEEAADSPTTSKRKSHKCLWLALLCIILIVIAVPIAVVLTRNSRDNGNATSSSQSADSSKGGTETTDNTSGGGTTSSNGDGESSSGATSSPTSAPLKDSPMLRVIQSVTSAELLADSTTPQAKAAQWLVDNEGTYDYQGSDSNRLQRYALSVLGFALFPVGVDVPLFGDAADSECEWRGVYCGTVSNATLNGTNYWTMIANETNSSSGVITELVWAQQELSGSIPTEIALLSSLEYLDFGENALTGTIPEEIFSLSSLQRLFLQNNQLQGTLSESFSQLGRLVTFYGGNNLFTGAIPQGLGSAATGTAYVRPLRK
ncbi:hypothetical protein MPSEU_000459900 [Mayamaea pseudoterrestris]|nr:hypothetical protein MPSEU_000459900 [Mayamaea pseudoterrestris]